MDGIERLKGAIVRVEALVNFYQRHLSTTLDMMDSMTAVTIQDLKTLLEGLTERDISLAGPKLKTGKEIEEDIKVAKVLAHQRKTPWVEGYNKGYKAGRDGEVKRIRELIERCITDG